MVLPLELTLANIVALGALLISVYMAMKARRTTEDTSSAQKLKEIETFYGERIALLQDHRKAADELIQETRVKAEFFKQHAERCEELLRILEGRVRQMERNHE